MELLKKMEHLNNKRKFENKAKKYRRAADILRRHSSDAGSKISSIREEYLNIDPSFSNSSGDVIENFEERINEFKTKCSDMVDDADRVKGYIDAAINEIEEAAERYENLAATEEARSRECDS